MPANPRPSGKSSVYAWKKDSRSFIPTSPAMAPDSIMVLITMEEGFTPLTLAAPGLIPEARSSNPNRVRHTST